MRRFDTRKEEWEVWGDVTGGRLYTTYGETEEEWKRACREYVGMNGRYEFRIVERVDNAKWFISYLDKNGDNHTPSRADVENGPIKAPEPTVYRKRKRRTKAEMIAARAAAALQPPRKRGRRTKAEMIAAGLKPAPVVPPPIPLPKFQSPPVEETLIQTTVRPPAPTVQWSRPDAQISPGKRAAPADHEDVGRVAGQHTSTKFRHPDNMIAQPLYVIMRILRMGHRVARDLAMPVVTIFDTGGREVDGEPGEGVWDFLRRTKLIDRAEIEWGKADKTQRSKWTSRITEEEARISDSDGL